MRKLLVGMLALALAVPAGMAGAAPGGKAGQPATAGDYLDQLVRRSPAPEYRRYGTEAMANVADWAAGRLAAKGRYEVVRDDEVTAQRWAVDYTAGNQPSLTTSSQSFKTESAFDLGQMPRDEVTCTVKKVAAVGNGDCGFVPFSDGSPEWKNTSYNAPADVAQIKSNGGIGAVVQGDTQRNLVYALRLHNAGIPVVVSVVPDTIVGQTVTLRARGSLVDAISHNVVGISRPPPGSNQYIALTAHMDGWFQAAADNGGGAAAVLRAADLLAAQHPEAGVFIGLMDGEEYGLLGSQKLAARLASAAGIGGVHMSDLKAVVNLDASSARASDVQGQVKSVAGQDAPLFSWRAMVYSEEPTLASLFISTFAAHQVLGLPVPSEVAKATIGGGSWRTDAQWFHQAGVPVAWPVAGYPEYHTDGDLPSAMDKADLENVAQAAADLVGKLATAPIQPVPQQFR